MLSVLLPMPLAYTCVWFLVFCPALCCNLSYPDVLYVYSSLYFHFVVQGDFLYPSLWAIIYAVYSAGHLPAPYCYLKQTDVFGHIDLHFFYLPFLIYLLCFSLATYGFIFCTIKVTTYMFIIVVMVHVPHNHIPPLT